MQSRTVVAALLAGAALGGAAGAQGWDGPTTGPAGAGASPSSCSRPT